VVVVGSVVVVVGAVVVVVGAVVVVVGAVVVVVGAVVVVVGAVVVVVVVVVVVEVEVVVVVSGVSSSPVTASPMRTPARMAMRISTITMATMSPRLAPSLRGSSGAVVG
jgi:hypothetical protein